MAPTLYIYPGRGDSFQYPLDKEKVSIGRSAENDIPTHDPFSSNNHACVIAEGGSYYIQDNQSKNGIFVNSIKIETRFELRRGDEILIGRTRVVFDQDSNTKVEITDESASTDIDTIFSVEEILHEPDASTVFQKKAKNLIISEVAKALILHVEIPELLENIMDLINDYIPMDRGVLMLYDGQPRRLLEKVSRINKENSEDPKFQISQSIVSLVVERKAAILIPIVRDDSRIRRQDSVVEAKIRSAICAPLWNDDEIIGIVYADRIFKRNKFTEEELKLLTLLSNLAAVKIEQARAQKKRIEDEKIKSQVQLAREIQTRLLPQNDPEFEGYEIAGQNIPCYLVGGDYYDYFEIDPGHLGVVIADVSGKGFGPGMYMTSLRGWLHAEIHSGYDIEAMAVKLNDFIHGDTQSNDFITFFYGELDRESGELKYLNAGHNPPFIVSKKKKVRRLETCGLCLGMLPSEKYGAKSIFLEPGDTAVFYTDGITECRNRENQEYTEDKLIELVKKHRGAAAAELLETIITGVEIFTEGIDPWDDMTLVVVRRN